MVGVGGPWLGFCAVFWLHGSEETDQDGEGRPLTYRKYTWVSGEETPELGGRNVITPKHYGRKLPSPFDVTLGVGIKIHNFGRHNNSAFIDSGSICQRKDNSIHTYFPAWAIASLRCSKENSSIKRKAELGQMINCYSLEADNIFAWLKSHHCIFK